jgi:WD40 repeat protein/tRNA A-37 threonylcarbamoyl transferase component Bud32
MSSSATATEPGHTLEDVLLDYFKGAEAGRPPDRKQFLARYPALADELRAFFDDQDRLDPFLGPLRSLLPPNPDDPEWIGSFGDYQVLGKIDRGGEGVVYKVRQLKANRLEALKVISAKRLLAAAERQRFWAEAEIAANLRHDHIVLVYQVGEREGFPFFSMELMEGGSLKKRLADFQFPRLDPRTRKDESGAAWSQAQFRERARAIARLLVPVAEAVHYAHQRGLLHRDLKPANILLDDKGQPHVTDFGLAKRVPLPGVESGEPGQTLSGAIVGTASYMAPEQAAGEKGLTTAVDVYGLGAILYELLTGQLPFPGEDVGDILARVRKGDLVPPSRISPRVPRDLETICLYCLKKDPGKRYASALEVADELRRFLAGEPIQKRPTPAWERAVKWVKRKPAVAGLAAAVVLVAVFGVAAVVWQWRRSATALADLKANLRYINYIHQADHYLAAGYRDRTEDFLNQCRASLRGWEWHYLRRLCLPDAVSLRGHRHSVFCVTFSSRGWLASGDRGGFVKLWDGATGRILRTLEHGSWVRGLVFSRDGRRLAVASENQTVTVWDVAGRPGRPVFSRKAGTAVALSPDGQRVAAGGRTGWVKVWDIRTGRVVRRFSAAAEVLSVAFSPDGKRLALGGWGGKPGVWELASRRNVNPLRGAPSFREKDRMGTIIFSPDGKLLATMSNMVRVWDLRAKPVQELAVPRGYSGRVTCAAFSPDGRQMAATFLSGSVAVWNTADGRVLFSARRNPDMVPCVAFSPGGARLAFARGAEVVIERWKSGPGRGRHQLLAGAPGKAGPVHGVAFTPDGRYLAGASGDGTIKVWDVASGRLVRTLRGHSGRVNCVAFSPDGRFLASASEDRTVRLWQASTGKWLRTLAGHQKGVNGVAFSPDGRYLASAAEDDTVRVWETAGGRELRTLRGHPDAVTALAFSPDGRRLASACKDWSVKLWDWQAGIDLGIQFNGHTSPVWAVAFSPDGKWLASASADETVWLWDAATGQELRPLRGHTGAVRGLAFSPGGRRLASADGNGAVKIWDTTTGQEILTLKGNRAGIGGLAFSPNGRLLASAGLDGAVAIWNGTPGDE